MYMKQFLTILLLLCSFLNIKAQTVVINTGVAGTPQYNAGPVYRSSTSSAYDASRYVYLYTSSELSAAGITTGSLITELGWVKNNTATTTGGGILRIYLKNSTATDFSAASAPWATLNTGALLVYENLNQSIPATATPNYITFALTTPYTYTGGSLEVSVEWDINQVSGSPSTGTFDWLWSTVPDRIYGTGQTSLANAGTLSSTTNSISAITDRRPFIQITYTPGGACTNPPVTGTVTASVSGIICPATSVNLNLSGNSTGTGLTYQWESSPTNSPFVPTAVAPAAPSAAITVNPATTTWYRAKLVCGSGTPVYSTPIQIQVSSGLPAGTYTINSAVPTGGTNYQSFTAAVAALSCGIAGPVVFNVVPGSGPYVETVNIGNVSNTNATNTIKFNGNGATVQFDNTSTDRALLTLNGSRYIKIDSLTFKSLDADYAWGAFITNSAAYDSITRCTFDLSSIDGTSTTSSSGIVFSGSATSTTTAGDNGDHCYIGYNKILGRTGAGGPYYGVSIAGASDSNYVVNNLIQNFYYYGIRIADATGTVLSGNNINRATKTATTTFYGIYTTGTMPGTIISGNRIHTPFDNASTTSGTFYGLSLLAEGTVSNPINVYNNLIYNINQGGLVRGIYASTATNTSIYHNSVSIDRALTGTTVSTGIYTTGTNTNLTVKNNNVSITAGTEGEKFGFYYNAAASVSNPQRNNFYVNSTQSGAQYYGYYTANYTTMAAFQTAYPALESGSVSEDPQFMAAASGNLLPQNFLLYGVGGNLNTVAPRDFNGTLRSSTPTPGAFEMPAPALNNAGTVAFITPNGALCSGTYPLSVSIINAGANTLNTIQINWKINGVLQTPYSYTGLLFAITNPNAQSVDTVTLGNVTLNAATPANIQVWTSNPNGVADLYTNNDSMNTTLVASMSGVYTINAALPASATNYQSFTAFSDDLTLKGICGPVVANVNPAAGPYIETVSFSDISGSSAVNTIKINGNGAVVQFTNTTTSRQLLTLNGTKYIKVDSLKFRSLDATYGWGALITNNARFDSITRCVFDLTSVTGTASANSNGIAFSASNTSATSAGNNGNHCYIGENRILGTTGAGGYYYGIVVAGTSDSNVVQNNELLNHYFYGIYVSAATGTRILGNTLHRSTKTAVTTFYGIYTTGVAPGTTISGNRIHTPGGTVTPTSTSTVYAIYAAGDGSTAKRNLISNNLVYNINQGGTIYGIYGTGAVETDIVHNTVDIAVPLTGTSTGTNYGIYVSGTTNGVTNVRNNIVTITGGTNGIKYGCYYAAATSVTASEKNDFYVNSTQPGVQNYGYVATAYATMAAFQTAYPAYEAGSVSADPQYAVPASGFFLPLNAAVNNGVNLSTLVSKDIVGITRAAIPTAGAFETSASYFNNAGSVSLINPSGTFCSGPRPVQVSIENKGINDINTLEIHWSINGTPQPAFNYTGLLDDVYSGNNTATVNIGTGFFPAGVPSIVKIWTRLPNGVADLDNTNDTITKTVQPSYSVVVNLGNDTSICTGNNLVLNAGNPGATYLWDNGATTQTANFITAGSHYVTVTAAGGCIGTDTLTLTTIPLPVVNLGNDTAVCPGETVLLNAGNTGAAYLWNDGTTTQTKTVSDEGAYTVTVTANGCSATDAITITHIDAPAADGINATYSDSATYTFYPLNPQFSSAYVWDFGDGTPTVSGMLVQHTYANNGIYTVTCTMEGQCSGTLVPITRTVDVFDAAGGNGTGIRDMDNKNGLVVYPNPGNGLVTIESKAGMNIETVELYSIAGQRLIKKHFNAPKVTVDASHLSSGIYLINVLKKNGSVFIQKIEIRK